MKMTRKSLLGFMLIISNLALSQEDDASNVSKHGQSFVLLQEDKSYLLRHNPFYFAYGNPVSKLQLSFRTPIVEDIPVYFAYTQLMFWELNKESKPIQDVTANPELFYRYNHPITKMIKSVDGGWMHTSNGKSDQLSRSYNSVYLRLNAEKEYRKWILRASLTGTYMHGFDDTNMDIQSFQGPFMLKLSFIQLWEAWVDKSELSLQATPAGKWGTDWPHGGYQISWSFRLGKFKAIPSFYVQYFTGYAESLANYNQYVHAFRGGFIF